MAWFYLSFPVCGPPTSVFLGIVETAGPKDTPGLILMVQSPVWGRVHEKGGSYRSCRSQGEAGRERA